MGRGRAKAKQTKVARDLKYRAVDTDFSSLERELLGGAIVDETTNDIPEAYAETTGDDDYDQYDEYERRTS